MADEIADGGTTTTTPRQDAAAIKRHAGQREPRFSVEDLRARPLIMSEDGYSAAELAMGLAGEDDPDAEYTRAEVRRKIETALERPVEHIDAPDEGDEEG